MYQQKMFNLLGRIIATIIVQEGPPVAIFSPSLTEYIVHGNTDNIFPDASECVDGHVRFGLDKLINAANVNDFNEALDSFCHWRLSVDGLGGPISFTDKTKFVSMATMHFAITTIQPMADQLREGLQTYDLLNLIQSNTALADALLLWHQRSCTADMVLTHLKPIYSIKGSERRGIEELVMVQFSFFVRSAEEADLKNLIMEKDLESKDMEDFLEKVTPGHVLAYATGANQTPAAGFRVHPRITFVHDETKFLPGANTCSYELLLFANGANMTDQFHLNMLKALMNGVVFSTI